MLKKKPVQSLWFEKDIVWTEILPSSNQEISQPSNDNEKNYFDSDTSSPKSSNSESNSVIFIKINFLIIMMRLRQVQNLLYVKDQNGPYNF